ncbi:EAL domain-containing protein [Rhizobacter sp. SG703]|uniref:EAL domain-containing protein n=1 Tax=Rhizobacter sp. SG703 TaxID=2587140 RepID=UPI001444C108|nr:EAL domain-containing protein [Rhizobacter sp. SG703]NKI92655.1 diguanylate cyclase (GGDEF)-like protein [Rhizobacter sp. SG703]
MSLIRQIWLLLLGTVLLAFAGSVTVAVESARGYLQTQLGVKNTDNATALALALSQQHGDKELMNLLLSAQFDSGYYSRIRFVASDGSVAFQRETSGAPREAPGWFVRLVPIGAEPGVAQVSDGWRALGRVELISQSGYAHDELWRSSLWSALALGLVGLLAGGVGTLMIQRIRRPLDSVVDQAQALVRGEFVTVPEPGVPELRRMTQAMNTMVGRLRITFQAQAEQLEGLRQQANCDRLTGLSNRAHFLGQLAVALQREDGTAEGGLVLLRMLDLADLNRALGHAETDRMITTVAQALRPYGDRVKGCFIGRLNGSDFALCLPVAGMARETAQALADALSLVLPNLSAEAGVSVGAVELRREMTMGQVMSEADAALARAESRGPFAVELGGEGAVSVAMLGEGAWRQRIRDAIGQQRAHLVNFPLVNVRKDLIHLECPLRLQLEPNGAYEPAARWLPLAIRSRLTVDIDECALALALRDAARDGKARCVNLSPSSLADSGFSARLRALLWNAPQVARLIWLEVAESAAVEHFGLLQELGRQLRPTGIRLGLEHAGERLGKIPRLFEAGLDYVKLDAAIVQGVGSDENRAAFVRGTVTLLHGLSLQVYAEGVSSAADAQRLWDCGIDGATGPWISENT